jgi:hypothetical protein
VSSFLGGNGYGGEAAGACGQSRKDTVFNELAHHGRLWCGPRVHHLGVGEQLQGDSRSGQSGADCLGEITPGGRLAESVQDKHEAVPGFLVGFSAL